MIAFTRGVGAAAVVATIAAMGFIVLWDTTLRLIPQQTCLALGASGMCLQVAFCGLHGLAHGALWACALAGACALACRVLPAGARASNGGPLFGGGDVRCMAALALASGAAAPAGFMACFGTAAAWSLVQRARGRLLPGEAFPFAPFLALWLAVALVSICLNGCAV